MRILDNFKLANEREDFRLVKDDIEKEIQFRRANN
jgi:hypothetical protein